MRKVVLAAIAGLFGLLTACTSIDCPLNIAVSTTFLLVGDVDTIPGQLTVTTPLSEADGNDSTLINLLSDTDSLSLPTSYARTKDTFYFFLIDTVAGTSTTDTVVIEKENYEHFESVDCSPSFFHLITGVTYTTNAIESIEINNPDVTYNEVEANLYLYFK